MSKHNSTRLTAVAGICLQGALDRITVRSINDTEALGVILLDELQRRGLRIAHARFLSLSLDDTQPLPVLLQRQAE